MKRITKYILPAFCGLMMGVTTTSCLHEVIPTNKVTQDEIDKGDKSGLVNAIAAYYNNYNSSYNYDIGLMGFNIWRDASTADAPVYSPSYDYFTYVTECNYLGNEWALQETVWTRYYALVQKTNLALLAVDPENKPDDAPAAVAAHAFRANAYMEMAQWYEFKKTGIAPLDSKAEQEGILGLTVPLVDENTTEAESRDNPRAPFYTMYRFILTDLNLAEEYALGAAEPDERTMPGAGVTYGLLARFWLLMGTRFDLHPDDLSTVLSHETDDKIPYDRFGVTSAKECFVKAAEYARKAINKGYAPLSETQWFDPKSGFNSITNSWMWANVITTNNGLASSLTWSSWVSFMSPEATWGVSDSQYGAYRMIDARLYSAIPDADWRKATWIDPDEAADEKAFNTKYARGTTMPYREWKNYAAYTAFKFHPGNGDRNDSKIGNAVSIPLMRVEEMYLIEAEATGRAHGEGAGRALLESFMNTYRYSDGSYKSSGVGLEGFIDDVFTQKRIELWGEGQILWDYRRMEKAIVRGYPGTNHPELARFNSLPGYVAPWTTWTITLAERNYNKGVVLNPDPSHTGLYDVWKE